jgi:hypothetical protein
MLSEQVQEALGHLVRLQREAISGLSGAGLGVLRLHLPDKRRNCRSQPKAATTLA